MKKLFVFTATCLAVGLSSHALPQECVSERVVNPDEITVYFPALIGEKFLGRNVATVLLLQLMQTFRIAPWPRNPQGHHFGSGMVRWSEDPLSIPTHREATVAATRLNLLAQIVVWGTTRYFGKDVVADVNVTVPLYAMPGACDGAHLPCDFRTVNFERWTIDRGAGPLSVDLPSRAFSVSSVWIRPDIVETFRSAEGLPILDESGTIIGRTGISMRFEQIDATPTGPVARVTIDGRKGWVRLPEFRSKGHTGELTEMIAGLVRTMRGDWRGAEKNFKGVVDNPATRSPLRLDALLLLAMVQTRGGRDGTEAYETALNYAPFDYRPVQYAVMGMLACGGAESSTLR